MKQFWEAIEQNPELKARVEALKGKEGVTAADVIAIAKEYGFELTEEDFKPESCELSDDELAAVSAAGGCGCFVSGGGGCDGLDCLCIAGGIGFVDGVTSVTKEGGCFCFGPGAGATNRSDD